MRKFKISKRDDGNCWRPRIKKGYAVIHCVSGVGTIYDKEAKDKLGRLHFKKIDISDVIYVVNVGGYIGESTNDQIAFANLLNKPVLYYSKGDLEKLWDIII